MNTRLAIFSWGTLLLQEILDLLRFTSFLYLYYRQQRSWAKVIFLHVSVILLTGVVVVWSLGGCLQFFEGGGVSPIFQGGLQFLGGGFSKFFFFSNLFFKSFFPKISSGMHPLRRSMRGRYASCWNAFLFSKILT